MQFSFTLSLLGSRLSGFISIIFHKFFRNNGESIFELTFVPKVWNGRPKILMEASFSTLLHLEDHIMNEINAVINILRLLLSVGLKEGD